MKIDEVVNSLGFGRFHKRLIVMSSIAAACTNVQGFIIVFLVLTPKFRCAIPGMANDTYHPKSDFHKELINVTVPAGKDGQCERYQNKVIENDTISGITGTDVHSSSLEKCSEWVYDQSDFSSTAVTEFDLVCHNSIFVAHGQMAYMVGLLMGSFVFGILGDRFGRKKIALVCMFLSIPISIYMRWVPNFKVFWITRFFIGAFVIGNYANMYIIGIEYIERSKRIVMSCVTDIGGIIGVIVMVGIAYLVRDWRVLHLAVFIPFVLTFTYIWLLPESVRWLLKKGQSKKVKALLLNIAKENKIQLSEEIMETVTDIEEKRESILNIFTTPVLLKRFIIVAINWLGVVMVYYGLTLNSENLGGNLYINILTSFAIELPAYGLSRILINRIGRKRLFMAFMLGCGVSCISTLFPLMFNPSGLRWLTIALAAIGKLGATGAFVVLYIYSSELFPTTLRMSALGSLSAISRIGGITAPYIVELTKQIRGNIAGVVPLLIFGGDAIFCAMLCLLLPETANTSIPETVEDVKKTSWFSSKEKHTEQDASIPLEILESGKELTEIAKVPIYNSEHFSGSKKMWDIEQ